MNPSHQLKKTQKENKKRLQRPTKAKQIWKRVQPQNKSKKKWLRWVTTQKTTKNNENTKQIEKKTRSNPNQQDFMQRRLLLQIGLVVPVGSHNFQRSALFSHRLWTFSIFCLSVTLFLAPSVRFSAPSTLCNLHPVWVERLGFNFVHRQKLRRFCR